MIPHLELLLDIAGSLCRLGLLAVCVAVLRWADGGGKPRIDERAWEME